MTAQLLKRAWRGSLSSSIISPINRLRWNSYLEIAPKRVSFDVRKCHSLAASSTIIEHDAVILSSKVGRPMTTTMMIKTCDMSTHAGGGGSIGPGPPLATPLYTTKRSYEKSTEQVKYFENEAEYIDDNCEQESQIILHSTSARQSLISEQEIVDRQRRLGRSICEWLNSKSKAGEVMHVSPLILIPTAAMLFHPNTNIPIHDCKQNPDFTYLTGLHPGSADQSTADCVLALYYTEPGNLESFQSIIFAPLKTKSDQLWHGDDFHQLYRSKLTKITNEVRPLADLVDFVNEQVSPDRQDVFVSRNGLHFRPELVTQLKHFIRHSSDPVPNFKGSADLSSVVMRDASPHIDRMRAIKSEAEVAALKRIGQIGARSLKGAMEWTRHMMVTADAAFLESHIAAKFEIESLLRGAKKLSFPGICASGHRSTIIHYGRNDALVDGWVLTDVGCEDVDGYCCDLSRTWPAAELGASSSDQLRAQLYEALVAVQYELIKSVRVDETSLDDLHRHMQKLLVELLIVFDVFEEQLSRSDITSLAQRLCPHHVSHYIGLDIHDTPTVSRSQPLQAGMCFSIEPGLYFPLSNTAGGRKLPIKPQFRGIGLRIEDDFIIEPCSGLLSNLTKECPMY